MAIEVGGQSIYGLVCHEKHAFLRPPVFNQQSALCSHAANSEPLTSFVLTSPTRNTAQPPSLTRAPHKHNMLLYLLRNSATGWRDKSAALTPSVIAITYQHRHHSATIRHQHHSATIRYMQLKSVKQKQSNLCYEYC